MMFLQFIFEQWCSEREREGNLKNEFLIIQFIDLLSLNEGKIENGDQFLFSFNNVCKIFIE